MRPLRRITLEFEDGTKKEVELPEGTGFYRERYTYESDGDSRRLVTRLDIYEVFWAVRTPYQQKG